MAFYDDFDYDLLNKDTNQIGGAYKSELIQDNDSMISSDNLKILDLKILEKNSIFLLSSVT